MTTYFESASKGKTGQAAEPFGPNRTIREDGKGKEYQLFIHIVDMLTNQCFRKLDRNSSTYKNALPFIRRFGNGRNFHLKTEEERIDGFPDFFAVRKDIVCIVDHSRIDSSPRRKKKKNSGTEYMALLGRHNGDPISARKDDAFRNLDFSPENLKEAVHLLIEAKATKVPQYKHRVGDYISKMPDEVAIIDGAKPKEAWLLVEDTSPESGRYSDEAIEQLTAELDMHPEITGLIYVYAGYPNRLPHDIPDIQFIIQGNLV